MYNGKKDVKCSNPSTLTEIVTAINELGALSSPAPFSRRECLRENRLRTLVNPRYVSGVSVRVANRYAPYNLPRREERHRTRSENGDSDADVPPVASCATAGLGLARAVVESAVSAAADEIQRLKKAKSLESVVGPPEEVEFRLPEVEAVSSCIERLRVDDR